VDLYENTELEPVRNVSKHVVHKADSTEEVVEPHVFSKAFSQAVAILPCPRICEAGSVGRAVTRTYLLEELSPHAWAKSRIRRGYSVLVCNAEPKRSDKDVLNTTCLEQFARKYIDTFTHVGSSTIHIA
jgi:hypothetical protein